MCTLVCARACVVGVARVGVDVVDLGKERRAREKESERKRTERDRVSVCARWCVRVGVCVWWLSHGLGLKS